MAHGALGIAFKFLVVRKSSFLLPVEIFHFYTSWKLFSYVRERYVQHTETLSLAINFKIIYTRHFAIILGTCKSANFQLEVDKMSLLTRRKSKGPVSHFEKSKKIQISSLKKLLG